MMENSGSRRLVICTYWRNRSGLHFHIYQEPGTDYISRLSNTALHRGCRSRRFCASEAVKHLSELYEKICPRSFAILSSLCQNNLKFYKNGPVAKTDFLSYLMWPSSSKSTSKPGSGPRSFCSVVIWLRPMTNLLTTIGSVSKLRSTSGTPNSSADWEIS